MPNALRKQFYEFFARKAKEAGIAWAVLSGIEGYPADIGRDLDVACRDSQEAQRLRDLFVVCLRQRGFRWIVYPSPIWGRRILGITEDYAAVELHIVSPVRIGSISLVPAWDRLDMIEGLFPVDPLLRYFKRCLMPALTRNEAWRRKCAETAVPARMPWWIQPTARRIARGEELARADSLKLSALYFVAHPAAAIANLVRWRFRRGVRRSYPAAPVYQLADATSSEYFLALARTSLAQIFTGFICVDDVGSRRINALQAIQNLTFLTRSRPDVRDVRVIPGTVSGDRELLTTIVEAFVAFNERWKPKEPDTH